MARKKLILKYKIIFFLIIVVYSLYYLISIQICLCTVGKQENKYIREFVEYYKKYGVNKIFLYDNNEINGEKFEDVISDYIDNKYVELINHRGKRGNLINIMNDCYQNNYKNYDWLIFYEIDEFIYLKGFNDIKNYLSQTKFDKCEAVQLNWVHRSDNNKIYYESKPVQERFPEKGKNVVKDKKNPLCDVKTIVRGHLNNIRVNDCHLISNNLKGCNGFGNKSQLRVHTNLIPDYDFFYINHYFGKSTEEFVNKIKRGDINWILYNNEFSINSTDKASAFPSDFRIYFLRCSKENEKSINLK